MREKLSTSYKRSNSLTPFCLASKCCVMLTDLGNFSGRTRTAVSVREGQGVVLMCSPPPHSPGTVGSILYCCCSLLLYARFFNIVFWLGNIPGKMCMVFKKYIGVPDMKLKIPYSKYHWTRVWAPLMRWFYYDSNFWLLWLCLCLPPVI